jgi:tetratricopeptide (TPR) repeat protein
MPACVNCGREIATDFSFCPYCGHLVQQAPEAQDTAMGRIIDEARRALDRNPNDALARYNLALGYRMTGLRELALRELMRVAEQEPEYADAFYEIGAISAEEGRRDQAIPALRRALQLEPEHRKARRLLAKLEGE